MLLLHSMLVPINLYRLAEMVRLTRHVRAAEASDNLLGIWLRPYMRSARLADGAVLFRKGDIGDRIYLLVDGLIDNFIDIANLNVKFEIARFYTQNF